MIKFGMKCDDDHAFEGWFASSEEFERQSRRGFVSCPVCDSTNVRKSLQAPAVSTSRSQANVQGEVAAKVQELMTVMRKVRDEVTRNATDVGERFASEARAIHYGEKPEAAIYGKATPDDAVELVEEGIAVLPLPLLPEEAN